MTDQLKADAAAAVQYLMWAVEFIDKTGNDKAARLARRALQALRDDEADRFSSAAS